MNATLHSEQINEIGTALSKMQAKLESVKTDATNPYFKSSYATLDAVLATVRQPLADHGLALTQLLDQMTLVTVLIHTSGQWIKSFYPLVPTKQDPQQIGAAVTYARRSAIVSIVGLAQSDDDGNSVSAGKWDMSKAKFFAHVQTTLGIEPNDAAEILRNAGYTSGYRSSNAELMFGLLAKEQ